MNRTTFSLSVFGERAALMEHMGGGSNAQYIMYLKRQLRRATTEVLSEAQRRAVVGYYFEGKSMSALAKELGLNRSTVSRNLKRARGRLSAALRFCEPYDSECDYI